MTYCIVEGCISKKTDKKKYATFNFPGEKIPMYCKLHSTNEMIDVKRNPYSIIKEKS
jgi:hypothetical protein